MMNAQHFGPIYGIDTPRLDCDRLSLLINSKHLEHEVGLMHTKWFDYRGLTAVQATYLFAHHYVRAWRTMMRRHVDHRIDDTVRPWRGEDVFKTKPQTLVGIWRARQHADAMGIPYEDYLADAYEMAMSMPRDRMPLPVQLYTDRIIEHVDRKWEERQRAKLYVAEMPIYQSEHYMGLRAQDDHHEWLFRQIGHRPNALQAMRAVLDRGVMVFEKLQARFADVTHEAIMNA
jgi:hypothetical protein